MDSITQVFSQKNVQEMQNLEQKTRHEIELKKEELRQMVGERYRDLIEAADTISEMKACSTLVKESITDLQQFCSSKSLIKGRRMSLFKKRKASKDINRYMEIAAEAKVLMEMPEKIWSYVEAGQMINASFLYLQSLQVLKNLSLDGTTTYSPVLLWFPMLGQQAQAVGNLRTAILKECRSRLHDHLLHTDLLAEALCSIVILEKMSVSETLRLLLKGRLSVLQTTLGSESFGMESGKAIGAKAQICDSAKIIKQTILQVHDLFCLENGGLLAQLLNRCNCQSSQNLTGSFHSHTDPSKIWTKHLPSHTTSCLVSIDPGSLVLPSDVVQSCCLAWFADCEKEMKQGIEKLLQFTTTAKDLASIRTSLLQALAEDNDEIEESAEMTDKWSNPEVDSLHKPASKWLTTCKVVFNREIQLWKELIRNLFVKKVNSIVKDTFNDLLSKSKQVFTSSSESLSLSQDICSYIWQEHEDDLSSTTNLWQMGKQKDLGSRGGLSLKASTVTPSIQQACKGIDETMVRLLADLDHYVCDANAESSRSIPRYPPMQEHSAPRVDAPENKVVMDHLKSSCHEFLHMLISHIKGLKHDITCRIADTERKRALLDHVLHLSLLCRNFFELCHFFKQCCCPYDTSIVPSSLRRQLGGSASKSKADPNKDASIAAWTSVVQDMAQEGRNFMTIWCKAVLSDALETYKAELLASALNGNLLNSVALWDSIAVEEESETGDKVTSQIKIPASTTAHTQKFMYKLCSELNRVGGYSTSRCTLHRLSLGCLNGFYQAFSEARRTLSSGDANLHGQSRTTGETTAPSQAWALQCLFDLRYAHSLLYRPPAISSDKIDDEEVEDSEDDDTPLYTFTELVDWLEGYVDPFDLDVFSPHITRNIQRHVSRTCVLLGMLTSPEKISSSSSEKFVAATKDSHSVLPVVPDCGRFSYLPVSGRSSHGHHRVKSSISRQLPLSNALRDLSHSSVDEDEKNHQNKLTSSIYSKLGALSSSWLSMSSSYTED